MCTCRNSSITQLNPHQWEVKKKYQPRKNSQKVVEELLIKIISSIKMTLTLNKTT